MIFALTIAGNNISPRFDMTTEIMIVQSSGDTLTREPRTILLNRTSPDEICELIIQEKADCIICGGIEERYYKYITWKKTKIIESVIGSVDTVLSLALNKKLIAGAILPTS